MAEVSRAGTTQARRFRSIILRDEALSVRSLLEPVQRTTSAYNTRTHKASQKRSPWTGYGRKEIEASL